MKRVARNVSIIMRTERLIAQRHTAVLVRRAGLTAAAGLVAGLAIIMLNLSGYLALSEIMSPALAACMVALANLLIAALLMALAGRVAVGDDTQTAAELRDMAIEDIEAELEGTVNDLRNMARDPLGMVAPGLMGAVAKTILKTAKK